MPKFKEVNFWLLYIVSSFIIILIACFILYTEWFSNKNKYIQELISINRITTQNTISALRYQESILKILGKNLLNINAKLNPELGRETIEEMIEVNKGIVAFGLAKFNGQLILVSTLKKGSKLPNLMKNEKTRQSFEEARQSSKMQLGRSYYMKQLQRWVIPIRMGVQDSNGNIPLVMTAGIEIDGGDTALNVKELPSSMLIQVIRKDGYLQFQNPLEIKNYKKVYNLKFNEQIINKLNSVKDDEIKLFDTLLIDNKKSLSSVYYIKDFDLYVLVSIPYSKINEDFLSKLISSLLLLVIILLMLYILFKYSITIQKRAREHLRYIAKHDTLTELPNRLALHEEMIQRVEVGECFYILFLDLDNFKQINDTYSHKFGDLLLKKVAIKLKKVILKSDYIARISGDEFILLISENQKEPIRNLANKILEIFYDSFIINESEIYSSASIGISKYENESKTVSDLLNHADLALYKAKEIKSSYVFFSESIYQNTAHHLEIETQLRKAISKNEFHLEYQPKIDAVSKKLIGVEALLRWNNSKLGFVSPEVFIPIAEKSGIINSIGEFVIKKSQEEITDVWKLVNKNFILSVNVSARQLASSKDILRFKNTIKNSIFPSDMFIIEVTENIFISDSTKTIMLLEKLRSYGIGVSLDDFGTGYSSLSILSKLPITELKIDKSFIQNMLLNNDNKLLVKSIINIGKDMHVKIVAEGVESEEELALLESFGCEIYQGYYFSKPLSKDELTLFIKNKT